MEGDLDGWRHRSATAYRRLFREAGLHHCGFRCWIDPTKLAGANELELARR